MTTFLRKSLLALGAGVLALAMPLMAQAAPLIEGGTNNDLLPGVLYNYDQTVDLTAGTNTFVFALTPKGTPGSAITTTIALGAGFSNASFVIAGSGGPFTPDTESVGGNFYLAEFFSVPFVIDSPYTLTLQFDLANAAPDTDVNVQVEVVPLPAAGLLILGALGGLGLAARRRKSTEA
jgi:hypothetical protein